MTEPLRSVFFGGEPLAGPTLEKLQAAGLLPALIVCNPDRPAGRGQHLTPPPIKEWAQAHHIPFFQPTSYHDEAVRERLSSQPWDLFVVVAYNFILPEWLLAIPKRGVLNVHPSLLPKLRGASPIRSAILRDEPEHVGVTVMLMDKEMDHGQILAQEALHLSTWPIEGDQLDEQLAALGGALLARTIRAWVAGEIMPRDQDHESATYCHKLRKDDAELEIDPLDLPAGEAGRHALRIIHAFAGIGDAFFIYKNKRVKIKKAEFAFGKLRLLRVTPEGKKEIDFEDYLRSIS